MNAAAPDLTRLSCLTDYELAARVQLPADIWAYLHAGAGEGVTQRWNEQAFEDWTLLPRVLRSSAGGDMAVELLGHTHPQPILIAPTAYHALAHPQAERATALAAAAMQTGYVVSTLSSVSLEDVAAVHQQALSEAEEGQPAPPLWFQLYLQPDREVSLDLLRRAESSGYQAIVVTVDAPIQGLRNADQRQGFQMPPGVAAVNLSRYGNHATTALPPGASLFAHPFVTRMATWDDLAWLIQHARIPVLVKGILHPADAALALAAGAAGIIVSNHGGRALDTVPATLAMLPAIVAEVAGHTAGRVPVLMDGGVRRGTDVIKALALGASAVLIGRPVLHGLAVAGATGAAHVLNILRSELAAAMVLAGCRTLADVTAGLCVRWGNTQNHQI